MASTLNRESVERLLDTGADVAQLLRDIAGEHGLEDAAEEVLDPWERAYHALESELIAPRSPAQEVAP